MKQPKIEKLPLNRAIISDILLWLALALALAYGIYFFAVVLPAKRGQVITLNFHNANEISKGSPVRMMGTDIGFVSDLYIKQDHVEVTIQTYPDTMEIPSGATFDILFTGLGGAKSVEIVAPDVPQPTINHQPVYLVEDPIRMQDVLNSSIDVTQALQKGAENITDFFGKKKPVEELQFNIREAHSMSAIAMQNSHSLNQAITDIRQQARDNSLPAIATLRELSPGLAYAASITNPTTAKPELRQFFQSLQKLSQVLQDEEKGSLSTVSMQQKLTQLNQLNSKVSQNAKSLDNRITQNPLSRWLQTSSTNRGHLSEVLDRAATAANRDVLPTLKKAHSNVRKFNQQLVKINSKISQPTTAPASSNP